MSTPQGDVASGQRRVPDAAMPCLSIMLAALALSGAAVTADAETCPVPGARCGHITRPLDPSGKIAGEIGIGYALIPHRDKSVRTAGTIVATEGGPGFPTTGSSVGYLALFAPLLGDHDLLLIDNRGTGTSGPIDCRALQTMQRPTVDAVGACGRSLGAAADFYGSPLAADDLAAVLDRLGVQKIDLYGDSYGTFTAQIFAARHGDRLRSLVLDGAFATRGESGFFPNTPAAIRRDLSLACDRSPACRQHTGTPLDRLMRVLDRLRASPLHGLAPNGISVTLDPALIGMILYDATFDPLNLTELDAAARAWLDHDDALPLLRLGAETAAHADSRDPTGNAALFSYGLFAAVSCMDYPQLYDMNAAPAIRRSQLETALAAKQRDDPRIYAPLSIDEWRSLPLDDSVLDLCLDWPVSAPPYPPGQPSPAAGRLSDVPVLILSGELDTTTPVEDATMAASGFPNARHLVLANSFHVDAIDDQADCAAPIVRRFARDLDPGDVSCAGRIPPIALAPDYVRHADEVAPAMSDDTVPPDELAIAAAMVDTATDVLERTWRSSGGAGLRGGRFMIKHAGDKVHCTLRQVRWAEDLAVSGDIVWTPRNGAVEGMLSAGTERLTAHWNLRDTAGRVAITIKAATPAKAWMAVP